VNQEGIVGRRWSTALSVTVVVSTLAVAAPVMSTPPAAAQEMGQARNVIFYLGDGMGQAHRDAGQLVSVGLTERLAMDSLPVVGMVGTNAAGDAWITDSAAAATSFGTGVKTTNGMIGLDADGQRVANIVELAKASGKSVGLVTTSQVTDASPAAVASHVENRSDQSEIARQLIEESQVDVILGGGEDHWLPEGTPGAYPDNPEEDPEEASRSDKGDLIARAQELGYEYVSDAAGLDAASGPKLLGLFANEEMFQQFPEQDGGIYEPVVSLDQMTHKAIDILSQDPDGFFLFVEEEATDEMSHANNAELTIKGVMELDTAVQTGLDFQADNPDTLVLVTADHECGGMTIETLDDPEFADEGGPGGTYVAEGIATPAALAEADEALISGEDGPFPIAGSHGTLIVDWTTTRHTAVKVPLTAIGPGAESLAGYYENTHIFDALVDAMGLSSAAAAATPEMAATPAA